MEQKRIEWIDYAKSLSMLCVMVLHLNTGTTVCRWLCATNLVAFFFLSGYLFSYERNPEFIPFLRKRFRQLVVPYIWINILTYAVWFFVLRHLGSDINDSADCERPLWGIALGIPPYLIHDIPLWSFLSFFVVEALFYPLFRLLQSATVILALALGVNVVIVYIIPVNAHLLPLTLGPSIAGLAFYSLGYLARQKRLVERFASLWLCVLALGLMYLSAKNNPGIDFYVCRYGNYLWFLLYTISKIYAIVYVSILLTKIGYWSWVRFISKSTLIIGGFHLMMYAFIKGVCKYVLCIDPSVLVQGTLGAFAFALLAMILCLPVAYVIFKYFRVLVDK